MKALSIIGGRPHLIKAEAVHSDLVASGWKHQSIRVALADRSDYPEETDFDLPTPSHRIIVETDGGRLTKGVADALLDAQADVVLLYGDLITSHFALPAVLVSNACVAHVESGYRSHDFNDFEERTRVLCDHAADIRLAYNDEMVHNLVSEGLARASIGIVPDPARITLLRHLSDEGRDPVATADSPGVVTLHRDETVHSQHRLTQLVSAIGTLAHTRPLHVILYKRTERYLSYYGLMPELEANSAITITSTLRYDSYLRLLRNAPFVVTDSSGLQDDCATLGVPCLVVRDATSRPPSRGARLVPGLNNGGVDLSGLVTEITTQQPEPTAWQPRSATSEPGIGEVLERILTR